MSVGGGQQTVELTLTPRDPRGAAPDLNGQFLIGGPVTSFPATKSKSDGS